jgi:hypothetical protein
MGKRREGAPPASHRRARVPPPASGEVSARMLAKLLKIGKEDRLVHIKFSLSVPKTHTSESIGHERCHPNIQFVAADQANAPVGQAGGNGSTDFRSAVNSRPTLLGLMLMVGPG